MSDVTRILSSLQQGDGHAADELLPLVYKELRMLAAQRLAQEKPGQTLQPTALVHEAYVRLVDQRRVQWRNRAHFFGVAAQMMRRILVDYARKRRADKRGGAAERVTLTSDIATAPEQNDLDVLTLHESLERLAAFDPQQERIVELRYFGGLTIEETAEVVGVSTATVAREWTIAKAWLRADMSARAV
jgi:RNA polymerase sigma factor (TIGR02999 family)